MNRLSCRSCLNFEERRNIDNAVLCKRNRDTDICCDDFELDKNRDKDKLYYRFCLECKYFEDINGNAMCSKNHILGVACEGFIDQSLELEKPVRKNRSLATATVN